MHEEVAIDAENGLRAGPACGSVHVEQRVFEPDIARSRPGKPPTGLRTRLKDWVWDKLSYYL